LRTDDGEQAVAVKLFKGAVTSDGLPDCEMAACMHAGQHPNLVSAMARVTEHPDNTQALVMPLIPPDFGNLAGPPSLDSCTRDMYAADMRLSTATLKRWVQGLASALRHLHNCGITHGDFYAHNILCKADGQALLGDFGAASFFPRNDANLAEGVQRIEVRAFGYLLQELLERCDTRNSLDDLNGLVKMVDQCLLEIPAQRPLFEHIESSLQS
jgi:serine/threonine protein kinase